MPAENLVQARRRMAGDAGEHVVSSALNLGGAGGGMVAGAARARRGHIKPSKVTRGTYYEKMSNKDIKLFHDRSAS